MKKILFERSNSSYLPEIDAYIEYIKQHLTHSCGYDSLKIGEYKLDDFDLIWKFMGTDFSKINTDVVHEYGSLSTGHAPKLKNYLKKTFNAKPIARVFLNQLISDNMAFKDGIDYYYRDMGVSQAFFDCDSTAEKSYDFVYAGSTNRDKTLVRILDQFKTLLKDSSILIIGSASSEMINRYRNVSNINFTGRVSYEEVPKLMNLARYGLNVMPDIYPFNIQTATKVLEYCALKMPVITTEYRWIQEFENTFGAKFYHLTNPTISLEKIRKFDFIIPDMREYSWENTIRKSNIPALWT